MHRIRRKDRAAWPCWDVHGWAAKNKVALIKEYATTSDLGLRLTGKVSPLRPPRQHLKLSFPSQQREHFILLFVACSANPQEGVRAPPFQLRGCTPRFPWPSPFPHPEDQDRGGCPPSIRLSVLGVPTDLCTGELRSLQQLPPCQMCGSQ